MEVLKNRYGAEGREAGAALLNLHAVIPSSRVNGPGTRLVVFFQGCLRDCPGCFNPETHPFAERLVYSPDEVFSRHLRDGVEGITVSGGEPFMQPRGLKLLLRGARERGLTTVVYTGFYLPEILEDEVRRSCLEEIDVLVDGPFERDKRETALIARGSTNQTFHFLTNAYSLADFRLQGRIEVSIGKDGSVTGTGFGMLPFPVEGLISSRG